MKPDICDDMLVSQGSGKGAGPVGPDQLKPTIEALGTKLASVLTGDDPEDTSPRHYITDLFYVKLMDVLEGAKARLEEQEIKIIQLERDVVEMQRRWLESFPS